MNGTTEELITELVRKSGMICKDPDWPNTFVLGNIYFDRLVDSRGLYTDEMNNYPYLSCGPFRVRRETPRGGNLQKIWKEMNETDSPKSTDL